MRDARVFAADAHANPGAETESRNQQRDPGEFGSKKVERGADITLFSPAAVVHAGAESCAAKIESQNRYAKGIQRFRRLINDFVVHRAAKERMRMANDGSERRTRGSGGRRPENRFEASSRSFQEEIAGCMGSGHRRGSNRFAV